MVNLGWYKNALGHGYDALNDFTNSLELLKNKDSNAVLSLAIAHNNKAVIELKNRQFNDAYKSAKAAITLVEPLIFARLEHNSEDSLKEQKPFQEKLHVLLIAYRNFATVHKKLGNKKYAINVHNHFLKMANKLLAPNSKFAEMINLSTSSDTVRNNHRIGGHKSDEKPKRSRPFTSQSNATSKFI